MAMAVIGSFAASSRFEDVLIMLAFGTIGYFMRAAGWPRPPLLLGLVLGPIAERHMWTSVQLFGADFLLRPGVLIIFAILVVCVSYPMFQDRNSKTRAQETEFRVTPSRRGSFAREPQALAGSANHHGGGASASIAKDDAL